MINKIGASPAFTSKVRVVYDNHCSLRDFYGSVEASKQVRDIEHNGNKDIVTITPQRGRYDVKPAFNVQVMRYEPEYKKFIFNSSMAYEPNEIAKAYKEARSYNVENEEFPNEVRSGVTLMKYIV